MPAPVERQKSIPAALDTADGVTPETISAESRWTDIQFCKIRLLASENHFSF
jgi:hypothetical protein